MKILKNIYFRFFIFIVIYFYIFLVNNLFYTSTFSADYQKYVVYLEYFYNYSENTFLDQGTFYYAFVSIILNFFSIYVSPNTLQFDISFAIQFTNNLLILFGLIGAYNLMKQLGVEKTKIFNILIIINFFPPLQSLKLAMKPEVFVFALLPWLIFLLKLFLLEEKNIYLYSSIIPFLLIITSKGTALAICSLFVLFVFYEILKKVEIKKIFLILLISLFLLIPILLENNNINENYFLQRSDITENYNNKAGLDIIYRNPQGNLFNTPFGNIQISTLIGVTLLDTFDDYFLLDWNKDVSLFKKFRKNIIEPSQQNLLLKIDFKNRELLYNGPYKNSLKNLRIYIGILLTIIFYFLIFKYKDSQALNKRIVLSPLLGILILFVHSLGFPYEDFDPLVADTFKTYYYSPFLVISFIFVIAKFLNNNKTSKAILVIFLISSVYIYGFPKKDSSQYLNDIDLRNENNVLCEINLNIFNDLKNKSSSCTNKKIEFCKYYFIKENIELETSKFLIEKNISNINKQLQSYEECVNELEIKRFLKFGRLPIFNLTLFLLFCINLCYLFLRLDNIPFRIRVSKNCEYHR